ncbi:MAG TPA: BamA/TamA family outer membrane protein, partial [Polyangiaceae bacterium]|nr:BamA/TamA family outer membrane protein [Polyangiaceae bacterium]
NPPAGAPVVGYLEPKAAVGLQRRFGKHVNATLAYNVQAEIPFGYVGTVDPNVVPTISLFFPQLTTTFDLRNNPIHPHSGVYLSNDLQTAVIPAGAFLWYDVRIAPEARFYVPIARDLTLAVKGKLGFLLPVGKDPYGNEYRNDLDQVRASDNPNVTKSAELDRELETVYFRGFFSGGPNSDRGFPLRGIAPHGIVPFLNPATGSSQQTNCTVPTSTANTSTGTMTGPQAGSIDLGCSIPIGGFTQWEASVELRWDVSGPLGIAFFCDTADVSENVFEIRPTELHMSCGAGARYQTPVGPIRLDVGYRIQPLQVLGKASAADAYAADHTEGLPQDFLSVPLALAFGIGEAF